MSVKHMKIVNLSERCGVLDTGHWSSSAKVTVALHSIQGKAEVWINGVSATGRGGVFKVNVKAGTKGLGRQHLLKVLLHGS